jgi:hypothetical protein
MGVTELLTAQEGEALAELEQVIERGLTTFVDVGNALLTIRDERLYRADYATFEDYCRERWGLSRPRAYQLIDAANTVSTIVDTGLPAPANEGQARELARVPEEQRAEIWQQTLDATGGRPTAAAIRQTYQPDPQAVIEATEPDPLPAPIAEQIERRIAEVHERANRDPEAESDPAPPTVQAPTKDRRKPLPAAFAESVYHLNKAVERVERIVLDERWPRNAAKVAPGDRNDLRRALDLLAAVVERTDQ